MEEVSFRLWAIAIEMVLSFFENDSFSFLRTIVRKSDVILSLSLSLLTITFHSFFFLSVKLVSYISEFPGDYDTKYIFTEVSRYSVPS